MVKAFDVLLSNTALHYHVHNSLAIDQKFLLQQERSVAPRAATELATDKWK